MQSEVKGQSEHIPHVRHLCGVVTQVDCAVTQVVSLGSRHSGHVTQVVFRHAVVFCHVSSCFVMFRNLVSQVDSAIV